MMELYQWREGTNEVMITDAASDVGLLVADTACDKTVGTRYYLDRYEKEVLEPQGLRSVSQPEEETYRFGPGEPKVSHERRAIPVSIAGVPFIVHTSVVGPAEDDFKPEDKNLKRVPWLAGRDLLRELGAEIDLANDTVDFTLLGLTAVKLRKSSGGHPAIDTTEWPSQGYPRAGVRIEQLGTTALLREIELPPSQTRTVHFAHDENGEVRDSRMDDEIASDVSDDENRDLSTRADRPVFKPVLTPHLGFLRDEAMDPAGMVRHREEGQHHVPPGGASGADDSDAQVHRGQVPDARQPCARADGRRARHARGWMG